MSKEFICFNLLLTLSAKVLGAQNSATPALYVSNAKVGGYMKKWFVKAVGTLLSAFVLAVALASCANPLSGSSDLNASAVSRNVVSGSSGTAVNQPVSGAAEFSLTAGQHIDAGNVYVWKDATYLWVKYVVDSPVTIDDAHIWAGTSMEWFDSPNDLAPGSFPYNSNAVIAADGGSATAKILITSITGWDGNSSLYILTHAALSSGETAWGGDNEITSIKRWNRYISVNPPTVENPDTPPQVQYGTIAGGAYYNGTGLPGVPVTVGGTTYPTAANGTYVSGNLVVGSTHTVTAPPTLGTEGQDDYYYLTGSPSLGATVPATGVNFLYTYESIAGSTFYDANRNGLRDSGEPALPSSVGINLAGVPSAATTGDSGAYVFDHLADKDYTVSAAPVAGFVFTTPSSRTVNASAAGVDFGYFIDYSALSGQVANGFTIGYWKTNIDKAVSGKTKGIQVPAATLEAYRAAISTFALSPLNVATLQEASAILSKTGSAPTDLLAKQLMGSEFNYQNGAFIGGNQLATYFFLFQGEYMHLNAAGFSSAELLAQKDRYDAYNNSHGGVFYF